MAIRQTFPIDPQNAGQPKGIGVSILFNNGLNIFNTTTTTKEQVKSNLINYILTNKGERFLNPNFGGNLRASLFEPDSDFDGITARLEDEIYRNVPNIIINDIIITKQSDNNLINLSLNYSVFNQEDTLTINISSNQSD